MVHMYVRCIYREDCHHECEDEEGEPAGDEGAGDDGQRLGRLPLALRLQAHVLLLLRAGAAGPPPGHGAPVGQMGKVKHL